METEAEPDWARAKREEDRRFSGSVWRFWWKTVLFGIGISLSDLAIRNGFAAILITDFAAVGALVWGWQRRRLTYGILGVAVAILVLQLSIALKGEGEPFANGPLLVAALALFIMSLFVDRSVGRSEER